MDYHYQRLSSLHTGLSLIVAPIQYLVSMPISATSQLKSYVTGRHQLLVDNKAYQDEHLVLQAKLQRLASLESENEHLRAMLQSSKRVGERVLAAKLLRVDPDPYSRRVVLDKGQRENVYLGQPIIDAQGVVGQVIHVGPITSIALLITDVDHALPVQNNRSGVLSIAEGMGSSGELALGHVTKTADMAVGDLLVTSGLGQRFPFGYPVGTIKEIRQDPGEPFVNVTVIPSAHLDSSLDVLLVWPDEIYQEDDLQLGFNGDVSSTRPSHNEK